MNDYTFTVRFDRVPTDDEQDQLFDTGLDGNVIISANGRASFLVTQEAENLDTAILKVLYGIQKAGLRAVGIENEDTVDLATIARRTGRSYESVRLLAQGKRGPGSFPVEVAGGLYSWAQVRDWFANYEGASRELDSDADTLAFADLLLRARTLRPSAGKLAALVDA